MLLGSIGESERRIECADAVARPELIEEGANACDFKPSSMSLGRSPSTRRLPTQESPPAPPLGASSPLGVPPLPCTTPTPSQWRRGAAARALADSSEALEQLADRMGRRHPTSSRRSARAVRSLSGVSRSRRPRRSGQRAHLAAPRPGTGHAGIAVMRAGTSKADQEPALVRVEALDL